MMVESFAQVHEVNRCDLVDGTILRALRCLPYAGSDQPRWLLLHERANPNGPDRFIEARDADGRVYRRQAFTSDPAHPVKSWDPHPINDPHRTEAIIALTRLLRSPRRHAGVMRSRDALKYGFDHLSSKDRAERNRRRQLSRMWSIAEKVDLFDGRMLAHLKASADGQTDEYLVVLGGAKAPLQVLTGIWKDEVTTGHTVIDEARFIGLKEAIAAGDEAALTGLLVGIENNEPNRNAVGAVERDAVWSRMMTADAKARATSAGTLVALSPTRPKSAPMVLRRTLNSPDPRRDAEHPGVTMITIAVPTDQAEAFRARAVEAVRIYRATHEAEILSLDGENRSGEADDAETVARRRARVLLPLASLPGLGREAVKPAAEALGLSVPRTYKLIAALKADPRWEAIVPGKPGRRPGHRTLEPAVEALLQAEFAAFLSASDGSVRGLVSRIRQIAVAAGLRPPDKDTIAIRLEEARGARERGRIVFSTSTLFKLCHCWTNGWTTTRKGTELKLAGQTIQITKDVSDGLYRYSISGGKVSSTYKKRESAQQDAIYRVLMDHIDQHAIARLPAPERPLGKVWELSGETLDGLADDFARTAAQVRAYETGDQQGTIYGHRGPGHWYMGVGPVGSAWRGFAIAPHEIELTGSRYDQLPETFPTKQAALQAATRAVFPRFCAALRSESE